MISLQIRLTSVQDATLQILNATVFPNSTEFPGAPADKDYFQVVAQTTGTLDFQVYFKTVCDHAAPWRR